MMPREMLLTMQEVEPSKEWTILRTEITRISFLFDGISITNPTISECGRFDTDPIGYYGLTPKGIVTLMLINGILEERGVANV